MTSSTGRNYGRLRTATLFAVYVLMVAHIVHWKLAGRTLAPLELNEVMHTLELGIITAGFLLMALLVLATMLYMFVWPQVSRLIQGRSLPRLHIEGNGSAWSSFLTEDHARNLPGRGIAFA